MKRPKLKRFNSLRSRAERAERVSGPKVKARDVIPGWPKPRSTSANWVPWRFYALPFYPSHLGETYAEDMTTVLYHDAQQKMVDDYFEHWRTPSGPFSQNRRYT